jgi:hypothetical protein
MEENFFLDHARRMCYHSKCKRKDRKMTVAMTEKIEITEIKERKVRKHVRFVENLQLLGLALTIIGQVLVRFDLALVAQSIWLAANIIALGRDFYLYRPVADKVKNAALTALTFGLIVSILVVR